MAICDSKLYFARDVKVLIEIGADIWEIPVLDGFSFAQANNSSEIVLAEMESTTGVSRRGKRMFNDSLAPAEWSFTTYTRPYKSAAGGAPDADDTANIHAVEEVLWALAAGKAVRNGFGWEDGSGNEYFTLGLTETTIDFETSNTSELGVSAIYFILEEEGLTYKITEAAVNEVTVNFDIDGIAQLDWAGFGAEIVDEPTIKVATINEAVTATNNFIRQRITSLSVVPRKNTDLNVDFTGGVVTAVAVTDGGQGYPDGLGQTVTLNATNGGGTVDAVIAYDVILGVISNPTITTPGSGYATDPAAELVVELQVGGYTAGQEALMADSYDLTLTGGSITLSNNLTYLTPEELGIVNIPIGHVTGARSISGSFTNYLVKDPNNALQNDSSGFWTDMAGLRTVVTHDFKLVFSLGGATASSGAPTMDWTMPHCHIEIPTHSIDDVIALETNFTALGECISSADELTITYSAV